MARNNTKTHISVSLKGLTPIMFDKYAGDNTSRLQPIDKLYRNPSGGVFLPSRNIISFLSAQNTRSAAKDYFDKRQYIQKAMALLGFTFITPMEIPITSNGQQLVVNQIGDCGTWIDYAVARLAKGAANPKERPVIPTPWEVSFNIELWPNDEIQPVDIKALFDKCGISIGLGTYRGVYGKFIVSNWSETECE